ncbi:PhzF family phenazine biosynthesis protein [Agromyces aureus]|uniref:Phenazine biosynthesis protein PhzF n=1 Tax=Agromyces aureus TaxID=453304 RepID=A0A191WID0_9MICO|nr:PhzF family phenazine biosynthesis protein [Agromyces aureus]ANJ28016.1 phenazine biosynthesis protein PhzF [Agromyces aureus]
MTSAPEILRYAAFADQPTGGNPAGVVLDASGLDDAQMQRIAAVVDYAETAFVTGRDGDAYVVRYFSPIAEVPFCGHATVATAVALAERSTALAGRSREGDARAGSLRFRTPVGPIEIATEQGPDGITAAFTSIDTDLAEFEPATLARVLGLLGLEASALSSELPPRLAFAGNWHPVLVLADAPAFDGFGFDPADVRALMDEQGWPATITVLHPIAQTAAASPRRFEARNLFPVGRITEDPATGSAAAAVGGYLRALGAVAAPARIVIEQGRHVGRPGELTVDIPVSGGITVSGRAVPIPAPAD